MPLEYNRPQSIDDAKYKYEVRVYDPEAQKDRIIRFGSVQYDDYRVHRDPRRRLSYLRRSAGYEMGAASSRRITRLARIIGRAATAGPAASGILLLPPRDERRLRALGRLERWELDEPRGRVPFFPSKVKRHRPRDYHDGPCSSAES